MKIDFTNTEVKTSITAIIFAASVFIVLLAFGGCSANMNGNSNRDTAYKSDKSFSFKDEGSEWKVDFENDDIAAVYRDGIRIPQEFVDTHREMIYEKLNGLKSEHHNLSGKVHRFKFDVDKFTDDMKKFKHQIDEDDFMQFKFEFDDEAFEENMRELEENLNELKNKKIEIYIDSEDFKNNVKELEDELGNIPEPPIPTDVNIDIHIDMDKFKKETEHLSEQFKDFDFKIDSSVFDMKNFRDDMKELKKNLKGLKIKIHDSKGEMKKLNSFLDDLKRELVKDGYINSVDEDFDLEINKDETLVNDTPVKSTDHQKYKVLYKKHFDKELEVKIKIVE